MHSCAALSVCTWPVCSPGEHIEQARQSIMNLPSIDFKFDSAPANSILRQILQCKSGMGPVLCSRSPSTALDFGTVAFLSPPSGPHRATVLQLDLCKLRSVFTLACPYIPHDDTLPSFFTPNALLPRGQGHLTLVVTKSASRASDRNRAEHNRCCIAETYSPRTLRLLALPLAQPTIKSVGLVPVTPAPSSCHPLNGQIEQKWRSLHSRDVGKVGNFTDHQQLHQNCTSKYNKVKEFYQGTDCHLSSIQSVRSAGWKTAVSRSILRCIAS